MSNGDLKDRLTKEQYYVTQEKGTETPFSGRYWNCDENGVYHCICCGSELFLSDDKFNYGSAWPSFAKPVAATAVVERPDLSYEKVRTEVVCEKCGAHLGHVFPDESASSGKRYSINSASLDLRTSNNPEE